MPLVGPIKWSCMSGNGTYCLLFLEQAQSQGTTFEVYATALTKAVY